MQCPGVHFGGFGAMNPYGMRQIDASLKTVNDYAKAKQYLEGAGFYLIQTLSTEIGLPTECIEVWRKEEHEQIFTAVNVEELVAFVKVWKHFKSKGMFDKKPEAVKEPVAVRDAHGMEIKVGDKVRMAKVEPDDEEMFKTQSAVVESVDCGMVNVHYSEERFPRRFQGNELEVLIPANNDIIKFNDEVVKSAKKDVRDSAGNIIKFNDRVKITKADDSAYGCIGTIIKISESTLNDDVVGVIFDGGRNCSYFSQQVKKVSHCVTGKAKKKATKKPAQKSKRR
jgi:uncharacterized Zn ribbon protein